MSTTPFQDKINADDKSIGFDYQFFYFLKLLLDLKHGQEIGLEVLDDIHTKLPSGNLVLIQTKHTVQTDKSGSSINLTERDSDLWKTIYNWINIVNDKVLRTDLKSQKEYLDNTSFVLVTNKSNSNNKFLVKIREFQAGILEIDDYISYLTDLSSNTGDIKIKNQIDLLRSQKKSWLKSFISKIECKLNEDDLIVSIKRRIKELFIEEHKIDDVLNCLFSNIKIQNYLEIKLGNSTKYTFDEFSSKYAECFRKGRDTKLPIRKNDVQLPPNPESQEFIKQLMSIGDIDANSKEEILEFTRFKLLMYNNLKTWESNGELLELDKKYFIENCITEWKNSFRKHHRQNMQEMSSGSTLSQLESKIKLSAQACLDELRAVKLSIVDQILDSQLSNGQFYLLCDELKVGWHLNWDNKYGNN